VSAWIAGVAAQPAPRELHICHAGSLLNAFTQVEKAFEASHPGLRVVDSSGGSVDLVRRAADGRLECDVMAPADHRILDTMLVPAGLADYSIAFAAGRMVLAYSVADPRAAALQVSGPFAPPASVPIVAGRWYDVLTAPGVRIAGAHPFLDPGGYRSHLIFELAQTSLRVPGLYNAFLQHYLVTPTDSDPGVAAAPTLGKDFTFQITYEHTAAVNAARDASYRYARLPDSIDLSSDDGSRYAGSRITIPGLGTPGAAAWVTIEGSRVAWGVAVMSRSSRREDAVAFIAALLGPLGRAALMAHGPAPMSRPLANVATSKLPVALRTFVSLPK